MGFPCTWGLVYQGFTAKRNITDEILNYLCCGRFRAAILTGAGGEGKSTILMQLGIELLRKDYHVYWIYNVSELGEFKTDFLEALSKDDSIAFLVDNADEYKHIRKMLEDCSHSDYSVKVFLVSRANEWKYANHNLKDMERIIKEFSIGQICYEEAKAISKLILANDIVLSRSEEQLTDSILNDSNGFLLAAMLTTTKGQSLEQILSGVINRVLSFEKGGVLIAALAIIVSIEIKKNRNGQLCFCDHSIFREALNLIDLNMTEVYFRRCLFREVNIQDTHNKVQTRHPVIAQKMFDIIFRKDVPIVDEIDTAKKVITSLGNLIKRGHYQCNYYTELICIIPNSYFDSYDIARELFKTAVVANAKIEAVWRDWGKLEEYYNNIGDIDKTYSARWIYYQGFQNSKTNELIWYAWSELEKRIKNIGTIELVGSVRWLYKYSSEAYPSAGDIWFRWARLESDIGNYGDCSILYSARWLFKNATHYAKGSGDTWMHWAKLEASLNNMGNVNKEDSARWIFYEGCKNAVNHEAIWYHWGNFEYLKGNIGQVNEQFTARWIFYNGSQHFSKRIHKKNFNKKYSDIITHWVNLEFSQNNIGTIEEPFSVRFILKSALETENAHENLWYKWINIEKLLGNIGSEEEKYSYIWLKERAKKIYPNELRFNTI